MTSVMDFRDCQCRVTALYVGDWPFLKAFWPRLKTCLFFLVDIGNKAWYCENIMFGKLYKG